MVATLEGVHEDSTNRTVDATVPTPAAVWKVFREHILPRVLQEAQIAGDPFEAGWTCLRCNAFIKSGPEPRGCYKGQGGCGRAASETAFVRVTCWSTPEIRERFYQSLRAVEAAEGHGRGYFDSIVEDSGYIAVGQLADGIDGEERKPSHEFGDLHTIPIRKLPGPLPDACIRCGDEFHLALARDSDLNVIGIVCHACRTFYEVMESKPLALHSVPMEVG